MSIPVTILSGFLGSGKTTLINQLLRQDQKTAIAIIENEFGEAGIDGILLERRDNLEVVEMSNGCVCCSVRGEFAAGINQLLEQRDKGIVQFERIIIETTGLADPSPVVQTFFVDENLREKTILDACIVLADAEHIDRQLNEHNVAVAQIAFADRIFLTKTDRIDNEKKQAVLKRLSKINSKVDFFEVVNGVCSADLWLNVNGFELSDNLEITKGSFGFDDSQKPRFSGFSAQGVQQQSWNDAIQSFYFEMGLFDIDHLGSFMEKLIEDFGNDMLRYKGVFAIEGEEKRLILQGVHKVAAFDYGSPCNGESPLSKFVIIGRGLDEEWLRKQLTLCLA